MTVNKIQELYQEFIYKRTYSRWLPLLNRRETWEETTNRVKNFLNTKVPIELQSYFDNTINLFINKEVMPSMRLVWSAGPAAEYDNLAIYNCAYTAITTVSKFGELLYILMNGAGAGFSVERQYIAQLEVFPEGDYIDDSKVFTIPDSKLGWKEALDHTFTTLLCGKLPILDYSNIRKEGVPLKTFGGRASGPKPLHDLIDYIVNMVLRNKGKRFTSIQAHDICCMIANCVIVGGVRRSAGISFSNLSDQRMRSAKDGSFWIDNPQRNYANNSVAYTEKPSLVLFMEEWLSLMRSGTGERGIFNVEASIKKAELLGRSNVRDIRGNPCLEALLNDRGLCNLTEVVVRPEDTEDSLIDKIKAAVLLGCLQSTFTYFPNIDSTWTDNAERDRLLGVSLTGTCDCKLLNKTNQKTKELLKRLHKIATEESIRVSSVLNITPPKQVTLNKPSGTVSQLVNCASGISPRYSDYFIRRVRVTSTDPIAQLLIDKGVPFDYEVGQTEDFHNTLVFSFPLKAPRSSVNRHEWSAIEQLEYWKMFNDYWCDGNPSVTIYVDTDEWLDVGAWVYKYWDSVCGLSFLPKDGGIYKLPPYEEVDSKLFYKLVAEWNNINIDFDTELIPYEFSDVTEGAKTYACSGGSCEL